MRLLPSLLVLLAVPSAARPGDLPDGVALGRAVFAKFDPTSTRTGERVTACGQDAAGATPGR